MARRRTKIALGFIMVCAAVVVSYLYMVGETECPYCYPVRGAGLSDLAGKRIMTFPSWRYIPQEEQSGFTGNPGVYVTEHCPWCGRSGRIRRIDVFMGKRPESEEPLP